MMHRALIATTAAATMLLGGLLIAPAASAVELTSEQLTAAGFPKKPNTVGWDGTAKLTKHRAPQWQDVLVTGKAPNFTKPGQVLSMQRFIPSDTQGSGEFKDLSISTTVNPDRSFALHFQIGVPGTYGYRVGYLTDSTSPEFVGFQFQFTTTGSGAPAPNAGSALPVPMSARQLADAGFTRIPNITGWGGTATLSSSRVLRDKPVTIAGKAARFTKPGQTLELMVFVPTDRRGSGHFAPTGERTTVRKDRTFRLTFVPEAVGATGYSLGYATNTEWVGVEFQVKVRTPGDARG